LFFALHGENFEGYKFVDQAAKSGAIASVVNEASYKQGNSQGKHHSTYILVEDTRYSLGQLAAFWRRQFSIPVVAITGSNGKTTVKEMLASILCVAAGESGAVLSTKGNFNNDIGMPLTLLKLDAKQRYAVVELGMNKLGEIDQLTRIASPVVALINNAGIAHLAGLGSVRAIAEAKGEIFSGLRANGTAVINADDENAQLWRKLAGGNALLEFGLVQQADVAGKWTPQEFGLRLDVQTPQGNFSADICVPGEHNARNALAATTAAIALSVPLDTIAAGLEKFGGVSGRLQRKAGGHGAILIDDTYNANPVSARAAISVLATCKGKRVMVLGDMGELGEQAENLHAKVGREAKQAGIEKLYTLGDLSINAANQFGLGGQHFESVEELQHAVEEELTQDTTVLVKGSRFMKMERVVEYLREEEKGEMARSEERLCS